MIKELVEIGFDRQEAEVFLFLVNRKEISAGEISKHTGINRSVVYTLLERLQKKGFVSSVVKNGIKCFMPNDYNKIVYDMDQKKETAKALVRKLKKSKSSKESRVEVRVFEGRENIGFIFSDIINNAKSYIVLGYNGDFQENYRVHEKQFLRKVSENGVVEKILLNKGVSLKYKTKKTMFRELPFVLNSGIMVYNDVTAIFAGSEFCIVIYSHETAESYRRMFKAIWGISSNQG